MNQEHRLLARVLDLISTHIKTSLGDTPDPVVRYLEPDALRQRLDLSLCETGVGEEALIEDIQNYLTYSVNTSHKQFFNQLYGGFNLPAFLGEVLAALTNTSMYTYEVAPVGTLLETTLIDKLKRLAGFEAGEGIFLTGGSNANLVAMFSARNCVRPQIKTAGAYAHRPLCAFVSEQSHYSFDIAANLLGVGSDQVCKIPVDDRGRMRVAALEKAIAERREAGQEPFFVAATAGTTLLGAFDPFAEIAAVSRRHNLWLHVDGAFGGPVLFSPRYRRLMQGLEGADSFAIDAHKVMNVPLICSALLVRQKGRLARNLTDLDTEYLYHAATAPDMAPDLGTMSIQCGRRVDVLKLWLAWRFFGDAGYAARIDKQMALAQHARQAVAAHPRLELMAEPQSFAVCFRYRNRTAQDMDDFNRLLREGLRRQGRALVNYGYWKNRLVLRFVAANPDVETTDVDRFFDYLLEFATQLEEEA